VGNTHAQESSVALGEEIHITLTKKDYVQQLHKIKTSSIE
jgi:hypothetical protein